MTRKNRKTITEEIYKLAISMYQSSKHTLNEISKNLEISNKTLTNIIKRYESGENFEEAKSKRRKTYELKNSTFYIIDQIVFRTLSCNNSLIQREIKVQILQDTNLHISQSTISRKIKKMQFTRKRLVLIPEERNSADKIEARAIYSAEISRFLDENLVYLDETGFNQHTRRSYGYSPINTKAYKTVPANKNINRSLLCAICIKGVIGYSYRTGSYNSTEFMLFITEKIVPYFRANLNKILIMDNAKIHRSNQVQELLRQNNIIYKFLTPYSPELNPIEEFFAMLKSRFHSLKIEKPEYSIEKCLDKILSKNNNFEMQCVGFYRSMRSWIEKARRKEPFI